MRRGKLTFTILFAMLAVGTTANCHDQWKPPVFDILTHTEIGCGEDLGEGKCKFGNEIYDMTAVHYKY